MATFSSGSLTGGMLQVGIALVLEDRFSHQAREASSILKQLHNDAKNAVQANLTAIDKIANAGLAISTAATLGMVDAIKEGAEYVDMMTTVGAITYASKEEMDNLGNIAQELGLKTMFMAKDVASGMKFLAMAGMDAKEISQTIEGAAYAAGATGLALGGKGGAADMITNVIRAFRMSAEDAGMVGDMLTKATLSSNMSMTDLAESIRYASADMVMLGQSVPQTAALIGTLGNAGIQASMAGTAISNMARYLSKAIGDVQGKTKQGKLLKELGIDAAQITDAAGNITDLGQVLRIFQQRIGAMPKYIQNNYLRDIFGVRGIRAAVALMGQLDNYDELYGKIVNSQGFAEEVMKKRMDTIAGAIDIFMSAWQNMKVRFTEAVGPILTPILKGLASIVQGLADIMATPIGKFFAGFMLFVPILGIVTFGLIKLRVWFLRLKVDSQVTATTMFRTFTAGWRKASIEATRYAQIESSIIAQRRLGLLGTPAGILSKTRGGPGAGLPIVRGGANGTLFQRKNGTSFVRMANGGITNLSKAATQGIIAGSTIGAGAAATRLAGGAATGAAAGMGPVGWILIIATVLLPLIISLFKKSNVNTEESANNLKAQTRYMSEQMGGPKLDPATEMRLLTNTINRLIGVYNNQGRNGGQEVTVKVEGTGGGITIEKPGTRIVGTSGANI